MLENLHPCLYKALCGPETGCAPQKPQTDRAADLVSLAMPRQLCQLHCCSCQEQLLSLTARHVAASSELLPGTTLGNDPKLQQSQRLLDSAISLHLVLRWKQDLFSAEHCCLQLLGDHCVSLSAEGIVTRYACSLFDVEHSMLGAPEVG